MRLFHISEKSDISVFRPRIPLRNDMDKAVGLVWAINEECLPMFLTPRDCPRVSYHIGQQSSEEDIRSFFTDSSAPIVVIIESNWYEKMINTTLYIYEFDSSGFRLQDKVAGYYVSETEQVPIKKYEVKDIFNELMVRNVELRIVNNLWDIARRVQSSSLDWSLCRMKNALKDNILSNG